MKSTITPTIKTVPKNIIQETTTSKKVILKTTTPQVVSKISTLQTPKAAKPSETIAVTNLHKVLNRQGYLIKKDQVDENTLVEVRKELTVKPLVLPAYQDFTKAKEFEIYQESPSYLFLPRYYGLEKFGPPTRNLLTIGAPINTEFIFSLLPHQITAYNKTIETLTQVGGGILSVPCGFGKCLGKGTPILMFDGSIKKVEDIVVGDRLMGDDSTQRRVLSLARGQEELFEIIPKKGEKWVCNRSHILSLMSSMHGSSLPRGQVEDIELNNYLKLDPNSHSFKLYRVGVQFPPRQTKFDPYLMGQSVGDFVRSGFFQFGSYQPARELIGIDLNHLDQDYIRNSRKIQLNVLAGLIDACGSFLKDHVKIEFITHSLAQEITFLCRSLGFTVDSLESTIVKLPDIKAWSLAITGKYLDQIPTIKLYNSIKKKKTKSTFDSRLLTEFTTKSIGIGDYYGFTIGGNHRFLLGDFTVTHNTAMAIKTAIAFGRKTIVVVNKEFLMDQWIDSIGKFTGGKARVGILQQSKVEVEDKDFVIAMLHSLALKDYPKEVYNGFGLAIVDECFPANTHIVTDEGNMSIHSLYYKWKKGEQLPLIRSFNETTKQFEYKKMTYAWEKTSHQLVKIKFAKRSVSCTLNHQFLTIDGYKKAIELTPQDLLISNYDESMDANAGSAEESLVAKALNSDQYQILLGSFLGDGHLDILPSGRYRLRETHGIDQKEYCEWKADMFGVKIQHIEKNGYAQKPAVSFSTKLIDLPSHSSIPETKTQCPQWIIDQIDFRGIAIWFMDDGSKNYYGGQVTFSTCSFDEDTHQRLIAKFKSLGIEVTMFESAGYRYLRTINGGGKRLLSNLYQYIHTSMIYKLDIQLLNDYIADVHKGNCIDYNNIMNAYPFTQNQMYRSNGATYKYDDNTLYLLRKDTKSEYWKICPRDFGSYENYDIPSLSKYIWCNQFQKYGTIKVSEVKITNVRLRNNKHIRPLSVYDIEVEDNHNFIVVNRQTKNMAGPVVHNCHHISSEMFSKALPKISNQRMLGLSATPKRKDGLDCVLNYHMGNIFHTEKRSGSNRVLVKRFKLTSCNPAYETLLMKNGIKNTSGMITNLGKYEARNDLIIELIRLLMLEDRKILLLSSRRDHLDILFAKLEASDIKNIHGNKITFGFYRGNDGKNKKEYKRLLEESAKCDVVLGTHHIAQEGLDIPAINTEIMATPSAEVEQAVGRILRRFHEKVNPMVIDLVDGFANFPNQARTRAKFYKSEDYEIQNLPLPIGDDFKEAQPFLSEIAEYIADTEFKQSRLTLDEISDEEEDDKPSTDRIPKGTCLLDAPVVETTTGIKPKLVLKSVTNPNRQVVKTTTASAPPTIIQTPTVIPDSEMSIIKVIKPKIDLKPKVVKKPTSKPKDIKPKSAPVSKIPGCQL
jgi:superfamily II DNA or RNA helicase